MGDSVLFFRKLSLSALAVVCAAACSAGSGEDTGVSAAALSSPHDFDVSFDACSEFAGLGYVPAVNAQSRVPAGYTLAVDGSNAILVARVVSCGGVSVDGKKARRTELSQIGIMLVGPDASASINNYTLWFDTNNPLLAAKLGAAGVDSDNGQVSYTLSSGENLLASASAPHVPAHQLNGPVTPGTEPVPFSASWWFDGRHGTVRMRTEFPAIRFGGASVTLTTPAGSALAAVIGGTSLTFAVLDSFNAFDAALMEVRNTP